MPPSLVPLGYCDTSELRRILQKVNADYADGLPIEMEQLREMACLELVGMVRVVDAKAAPAFKQDDAANIVIAAPLRLVRRRYKSIRHKRNIRFRPKGCQGPLSAPDNTARI